MSAGNVQNDFLLLPMDSPKMPLHYIIGIVNNAWRKFGYYASKIQTKKNLSNIVIMATPQLRPTSI